MSSVKIQGSATGTANFTIAVPDGTSTDRTINLPDAAGSFVLADASGDVTVTGAFTSRGIDDNATSTAMTLDSSGNVGINNSSPNTKIDVIGSTTGGSGIVDTIRLRNTGTTANDGAKIQFTAGTSTSGAGIGSGGQALNSADLRFYTGGNTEAMRLYTNQSASFSNYIYPTVDNAFSCGLSGNRWNAIYAANGTIQTSDQRDKTDIIESPLGLDFVLALEPVAYKFKVGKNLVNEDGEVIPVAGARQHFGLISQQVKEVCGEVDFGGWVKTDPEDDESSEGLRYDQFVAPLVKAIQEQQAIIEDLQTRLAALEAV